MTELAGMVRAGTISARDVTAHALNRIECLNGELNAFVAVDGEAALAKASEIDEQVAAGEDPGPLAGIPIGVKDVEDAVGFRTTKGSIALTGSRPAHTDSVLVARLRRAGAVVVGKTNTPEFAWKGDTINSVFGATRNPWRREYSPGGSSGGTACAIAAGMVPLGTGSDAGGSIRVPAAVCGLSGFKPSLGRVPSGGARAPEWHHLSTGGPIARTVADTVAALDVAVGPDPTDLRSLPAPNESWRGITEDARLPPTIAWSPTMGYANVDSEVMAVCSAAIERLRSIGADIIDVDTVFADDPAQAWATLLNACIARTLAPFRDSTRWNQIDPGLRELADRGARTTAVALITAEDECHRLNFRLADLFTRVELLITPTTAGIAPRSGEVGTVNGSPTANWVRFTYPFNMTRSPVGTVCGGFSSLGLPVGLQVIGPQHGDVVVLRAMAALEVAWATPRLASVGGEAVQ